MSELFGNPEQVSISSYSVDSRASLRTQLFGNPEQLPYIPTTEEIRLDYAPDKTFPADAEAQFDRWLAEVKAQAWQEGWDTKPPYQKINNPYRQAERLAAFEKATPEDYTQGETE